MSHLYGIQDECESGVQKYEYKSDIDFYHGGFILTRLDPYPDGDLNLNGLAFEIADAKIDEVDASDYYGLNLIELIKIQ